MPSLRDMQETCARLLQELDAGAVQDHRLLEIETIVRLLVPHLTRALAEAVLTGHVLSDDGPRDDLARVRSCLDNLGSRHRFLAVQEARANLTEAVTSASHMLAELERA